MLLYGLTMMLALGTAVYLLWRRGNAFTSDEAESPVILRRWAAAFFAAAALSHVWWLLLSTVWMTGDKPMRDTTAVALDYLTLIPLMMATLLRMLQDCQRPVWPWIVAEIPVAELALAGIIIRYDAMPYVMTAYQLVVVVVFVAYYIMAVRQYSLWLLAGFADLSVAVGISRGALSEWFIEHDDRNFNGYIHRLRIDHFVRLYSEAVRDGRPFTVFSLARQCGYRNYLRFTTAFRHRMDCSLTSWTKRYTLSAIGEHLPD